ncbi:MAG: hypothetical protein BZ135_07890 [Methanosphaera sp. rholeuAM6]|nr:MAG: hypothetical protein BZ135_07890 [Methanosphaera sp. rholeuAM6]
MEVMEIIQDSFIYPVTHIQSVIIYVILGIIAAFALVTTGVSTFVAASETNAFTTIGVFLIGLIISVFIFCVIEGYVLDIVKIGIKRGNEAPSIDIKRQALNGIKLFVVHVVYFIIPFILTVILSLFLQTWLTYLIGLILFIIFALAATMAECKLAETDELEPALSIGQAIADISRVGIGKLLTTIIIIAVVSFIILLIISFITQYSSAIGSILTGIFEIYLLFAGNRAIGLIYSDA